MRIIVLFLWLVPTFSSLLQANNSLNICINCNSIDDYVAYELNLNSTYIGKREVADQIIHCFMRPSDENGLCYYSTISEFKMQKSCQINLSISFDRDLDSECYIAGGIVGHKQENNIALLSSTFLKSVEYYKKIFAAEIDCTDESLGEPIQCKITGTTSKGIIELSLFLYKSSTQEILIYINITN